MLTRQGGLNNKQKEFQLHSTNLTASWMSPWFSACFNPTLRNPEIWQWCDQKTSLETSGLRRRHHILTSTRNEANHKHIPRTGKHTRQTGNHIPQTGNIFWLLFPREPRKPCRASNWREVNMNVRDQREFAICQRARSQVIWRLTASGEDIINRK
jgi:hypothetical protein